MRPLLAITHSEDARTGVLAEAAAATGLALQPLNLYGEGPRPELDELAGLASFGGRMGVNDAQKYPFLQWELGLIAEAIEREVPFLGFCLGGQLLAGAAGGEIKRLDAEAAGFTPVTPTAEGESDPVFRHLPAGLRTLEWHDDYFELPAGTTQLASWESTGVAAFRAGPRAWGTQFHIEVDRPMVEHWIDEDAAELAEEGIDVPAFRAQVAELVPPQLEVARPLVGAFAELVREREAEALGAASLD